MKILTKDLIGSQVMNKYRALYKGKWIEIEAVTSHSAQLKATEIFKADKSYDVAVILCENKEWNECHDLALSLLTNNWQSLPALKKLYGQNTVVPFADLLEWGKADFLSEPLTHNGVMAGSNTFFKLGSGKREYTDTRELVNQ